MSFRQVPSPLRGTRQKRHRTSTVDTEVTASILFEAAYMDQIQNVILASTANIPFEYRCSLNSISATHEAYLSIQAV